MSPGTASFLVAVIGCLLSPAAIAGSSNDPMAWLERMSSAMSQMSYQGTFVYVQENNVETMRITHVAGDSGVRERLVAVSGPPREIVRDSSGVRWVLGDDLSVLADNAFSRSYFPQLPISKDQESLPYVLKFGKVARIAGQTARNVNVLPRDVYRYGYSLWLEEHSGLLLKWELIDSDRKPLAKLMFTDIRLGSQVDLNELKPSAQLQKFKTVESELPAGRAGSLSKPRWQPERLPPGFELTAHRYLERQDGGHGMYEHLVYSDGLAAVSIYVESTQSGLESAENTERHGILHAFSRTDNDLTITVVGDVPAITVQMIGNAIHLVSH